MDPLLQATLAGFGGFVLGVWADAGARRDYYKGKQKPEPGKPICGCGHHLSYHDEQSGRCLHKRTVNASLPSTRHTIKCSCQRYIGPELVPDYLPK